MLLPIGSVEPEHRAHARTAPHNLLAMISFPCLLRPKSFKDELRFPMIRDIFEVISDGPFVAMSHYSRLDKGKLAAQGTQPNREFGILTPCLAKPLIKQIRLKKKITSETGVRSYEVEYASIACT